MRSDITNDGWGSALVYGVTIHGLTSSWDLLAMVRGGERVISWQAERSHTHIATVLCSFGPEMVNLLTFSTSHPR